MDFIYFLIFRFYEILIIIDPVIELIELKTGGLSRSTIDLVIKTLNVIMRNNF